MGEESPSPPLGAAARCEQADADRVTISTESGNPQSVAARMNVAIAQVLARGKSWRCAAGRAHHPTDRTLWFRVRLFLLCAIKVRERAGNRLEQGSRCALR